MKGPAPAMRRNRRPRPQQRRNADQHYTHDNESPFGANRRRMPRASHALLLSSTALPMLRKLARRVVPGSPAEVARAALRTHSAAEARAVLSAFVASMGEAWRRAVRAPATR